MILLVRNCPDVSRTMLVSKRTFRNVWHDLGGGFGRPGGMQSLLYEAGTPNIRDPGFRGERGECECSVLETKYEDQEECLKPSSCCCPFPSCKVVLTPRALFLIYPAGGGCGIRAINTHWLSQSSFILKPRSPPSTLLLLLVCGNSKIIREGKQDRWGLFLAGVVSPQP